MQRTDAQVIADHARAIDMRARLERALRRAGVRVRRRVHSAAFEAGARAVVKRAGQ